MATLEELRQGFKVTIERANRTQDERLLHGPVGPLVAGVVPAPAF